MADGLSQEDIEALIAGETAGATDAEIVGEAPASPAGPPSEDAIESLLAVADADEAEAEVEVEVEPPRTTDAPLSPDEIAALIASDIGDESFEPATPAAPRRSSDVARAPVPLVQEIAYSELPTVQGPIDEVADIRLLMDVPLQITVELGQATRTIRELLEIGQGSILHLSRHAGEPVDVLVNGQAIAKGEVVVIDENFGIRVTEVVSPADRLRSMAV